MLLSPPRTNIGGAGQARPAVGLGAWGQELKNADSQFESRSNDSDTVVGASALMLWRLVWLEAEGSGGAWVRSRNWTMPSALQACCCRMVTRCCRNL